MFCGGNIIGRTTEAKISDDCDDDDVDDGGDDVEALLDTVVMRHHYRTLPRPLRPIRPPYSLLTIQNCLNSQNINTNATSNIYTTSNTNTTSNINIYLSYLSVTHLKMKINSQNTNSMTMMMTMMTMMVTMMMMMKMTMMMTTDAVQPIFSGGHQSRSLSDSCPGEGFVAEGQVH